MMVEPAVEIGNIGAEAAPIESELLLAKIMPGLLSSVDMTSLDTPSSELPSFEIDSFGRRSFVSADPLALSVGAFLRTARAAI